MLRYAKVLYLHVDVVGPLSGLRTQKLLCKANTTQSVDWPLAALKQQYEVLKQPSTHTQLLTAAGLLSVEGVGRLSETADGVTVGHGVEDPVWGRGKVGAVW